MNEYATVYQFFGSMIGLSIATLLYMLGGRSDKWKRRFIGSFILACTVNVVSALRGVWSPWLLCAYPLLTFGFINGYGASTFGAKVIRRLIYAFGVVLSGALFFIVFGGNALWVLIPHLGIGLFSVYMGVKNPIEAAAEEGFICSILNIGLIAYPFIV